MPQRNYVLINRNIREFLNPMRKYRLDCIEIGKGNTLEHELKKCEVAINLMKEGHTIITEAPLKNGKRPDIMILDVEKPICYEIMHSEKQKSIDKKEEEYMGLKIITVSTKDGKRSD